MRDADERYRDFGPEALQGDGVPLEAPDGVVVLRSVVDETRALAENEAKPIELQRPLTELYRDDGLMRAVVLASVDRRTEIEALCMELGEALTKRAADGLRSQLRSARRAEVKAALRVVGDDEDAPEIAMLVDWPEYPRGVTLPAGWRLGRHKLVRVRATRDKLVEEKVGRPLLVTRRLKDADDQTWSVELAWPRKRGEAWSKAIVRRSVALNARSLVDLADDGAPVSSATVKRQVEWLTELDQDPELPEDWCAARMGWVGHSARYFLMGETQMHAGEEPDHRVSLAPSSPGARQAARAMTTGGTLDGWLQVYDVIKDQPPAWAVIYAACSAPLLRVLDAPCYGIDLCGLSGTGKSTLLELGVSTGAIPRKGHGYNGWGGTLAGTEGAVGIRCDTLLALDEGQLVPASRWSEAGALLYALTEGAGRAKGQLGRLGMAHVDSWRTVLLSSSEEGITAWSPHDGVKRRIIELREARIRTADDTDRIRAIIREHHGHLLPRVVQHLVDSRDRRGVLKECYQEARDRLRVGQSGGRARSAAAYVASMEAAATILHQELGIPAPECDALGWLWDQVRGVSSESDRAERAWEAAMAWCWSRRDDFAGQGKHQPHGGWLGIWAGQSGTVAVMPEALLQMLHRAGYGSTPSIFRAWAERGWLDAPEGRTTRKTTPPGGISFGSVRRPRLMHLRTDVKGGDDG